MRHRQSTTRRFRLLTVTLAGAILATGFCPSAFALRLHGPAAAPAAQDSDAVTVPRHAMAGYILKKVKPEYPKAAKQAHISGTVILQARIGTDGTIQDLKVVSGPFQLLDATMHAVRQWTYKPYMVDGKPVAVETKIAVHYNLRTADADDY